MRVLVFEPVSNTRDWLKTALHERTCEVVATSEEAAAVERLGRGSFDVVIASYAKPQSFRSIRDAVDRSRTTLVALIDATRAKEISWALADGADDHLLAGLGPAVIDACAHRVAHLSALRAELSKLEQTQAALRNSEADYRGLFEGAHDAIMIFRPEDEVVLDVNQRACDIYRLTRDELIGTTLVDLSTDVPRGKKHLGTTLERGRFHRFETKQRRGDGTLMYLDINAAVVTYKGERAIVSINRDVTDLQLARERLERQNRELQDQQRLEALGRLAAGVAHDFNNLLTVIDGCAQYIERRGPGIHADEVSDILNATGKGADLVRQLMSFGQRDQRGPEATDVNALTTSMIPMLRRLVGPEIGLAVELADGLGAVPCDGTQLERILVNLVVNGRDAIAGRGRLVIRTAPELAGTTQRLVLSVTDDGCGMDEATKAKIFDPFFTTKGHAGTGLGLSTVYGIVTQAGGRADIHSVVGEGTTIRLSFPTVRTATEEEADAGVVDHFDPRRATGEYQRLAPLEPARFRKLMDAVDDAIYIADAETRRFVDVNDAAVAMLGFPREELLRMRPEDLKENALRGNAQRWADQVRMLRASGSFTLNTTHRHASGRDIPVEIRVSLRESGGREYVVGVCREQRQVSTMKTLSEPEIDAVGT